jgi:hypothetical protein
LKNKLKRKHGSGDKYLSPDRKICGKSTKIPQNAQKNEAHRKFTENILKVEVVFYSVL